MKEKTVLNIFYAGVFGNKSKWHKNIVQETTSPQSKKSVRYKILENGLHYYPLANNVFIIWLWIIHRVKKPRGTSQHEFSITNCSCKDIMKNICQNDISKTESEPK